MKLSISDGKRELDLLDGLGIYLADGGFQMPVVAREMTYADSADSEGRRRVRSKSDNAEGQLTVFIRGEDEGDFWDKVDDLLELVESCHRHKGTITYEPPRDGETLEWDVEAITVVELPQRGVTLRQLHAEVQITFEVRPYAKLEDVSLLLGETLEGPIDELVVQGVPGQVDAFGILRLTDDSSEKRDFVEVGVQNEYDSDNPEPLLLDAQALVGLTGSGGTSGRPANAYTQSSGSSFTIRAGLSTASTVICSTGPQPHKGKWKIRARVQVSTANHFLRISWRVGTGPWNTEQFKAIEFSGNWLDVDLGTIDVFEVEGTHTLEVRLEGAASSGLPLLDVDYLTLIPADRYLSLRGRTVSETVGGLIAADDFNSHTSGALSGKTPPLVVSGNWTGAGSATDFTVSSGIAQRTASGETQWSGRYVRAGTDTATNTDVRADFSGAQTGLFARYVDTDNWVLAIRSGSFVLPSIGLWKRVAGTTTFLAVATDINGFRRMSLQVLASGAVTVQTGTAGSASLTTVLSYAGDADTQTGGALANGSYGIYHEVTGGTARTAEFDNFTVVNAAPSVNELAVIHPDQALQINHSSSLTESDDGSFLAPTPTRKGKYLSLPPATRNEQESRIVVRARRNDIDSGLADTGLADDLEADLSVTPRIQLGPPAGS